MTLLAGDGIGKEVIYGANMREWTRVGIQDGLVTSDIEVSSVEVLGWCAAIEWRRGGVAKSFLRRLSEDKRVVTIMCNRQGFLVKLRGHEQEDRVRSGPGSWTP